jgi:8-hydroxy-5-deazaflavin:NADPH oxidoreductase
MNIAIIGAGNVGTALAQGWIKAGHQVKFGVRNPASDKTQKALSAIPGGEVATIAEAVQQAEVVAITTPADAVLELIPQLGSLAGKTVIDTTNAIRSKPLPYQTAYEAIKARTGIESVVKCFNTTGFENMADPKYPDGALDMFMAGSHAPAKAVAKQLALDLGFADCLDFGGDDKVALLEQWALCWINLAIMQGHGRDVGFRLVRR